MEGFLFNKAAVLVLILLIFSSATIMATQNGWLYRIYKDPFYVGVTNSGTSVQDAMLLIEKVKDCTNLFIVQSPLLNYNLTKIEQICDYAVHSGLNIIVYFGTYDTLANTTASFIDSATERWGNKFLGIYYGDEPTGKMIEGNMLLYDIPSLKGDFYKDPFGFTVVQKNGTVSRRFNFSGDIVLTHTYTPGYNFTTMHYFTNGTIELKIVETPKDSPASGKIEILTYFPNGTVTLETPELNSTIVTDSGDRSQFETYQEVWDSRQFPTYDEIGTACVASKQSPLEWLHNQSEVTIFTADFVLYWWDYLIGYDVVFAELGWNNTVAQEIGLVRGSAELQNKRWGTIITWTYNQPPYLTSGEEMYKQMLTSYECGADYVIVFNYAEDMNDAYGTLQEEHFQALEQFWNQVVEDPFAVERGSIKSEAVLVLPQNYGWGMRNPKEKIWGLFDPDEKSMQIWNQLQILLEQYDTKLDIVYEDPNFPIENKYSKVFYWNQTKG